MKPFFKDVRQDTIETINNFVTKGWEPGGFVTAVLENNLLEAFGRADLENRQVLFQICDYIYNEIPSGCHGSPEKVARWIDLGGVEGMQVKAADPIDRSNP